MTNIEIKKGDTVLILAGGSLKEKVKGEKGKVLAVLPTENKVIIENKNMVKRHTKPRSAQKVGGIIDRPRPIDVSNVMLICPICGKPTRIGHALSADGKKYVRQCKKCNEIIDKKTSKAFKKSATAKKAESVAEKPAKPVKEVETKATSAATKKSTSKIPAEKKAAPAAKKDTTAKAAKPAKATETKTKETTSKATAPAAKATKPVKAAETPTAKQNVKKTADKPSTKSK